MRYESRIHLDMHFFFVIIRSMHMIRCTCWIHKPNLRRKEQNFLDSGKIHWAFRLCLLKSNQMFYADDEADRSLKAWL